MGDNENKQDSVKIVTTSVEVPNEDGETRAKEKQAAEDYIVGSVDIFTLIDQGKYNLVIQEFNNLKLTFAQISRRQEVSREASGEIKQEVGEKARYKNYNILEYVILSMYSNVDKRNELADLARYLIEHSKRIDSKLELSTRVLFVAVYNGIVEAVKVLLECGYNPVTKDESKRSILQVAISRSDAEYRKAIQIPMVKLVVAAACDNHKKYGEKFTLDDLRRYLTYGFLECFSEQNKAGNHGNKIANIILGKSQISEHDVFDLNEANVSCYKLKDMSLLMLAAFYRNTEMLQYLLEKGANPNVRNKYGYTALRIMLIKGHKEKIINHEMIETLMRFGARPVIFYPVFGKNPDAESKDKNSIEIIREIDFNGSIDFDAQIKPAIECKKNIGGVIDDSYDESFIRQIILLSAISRRRDVLAEMLTYIADSIVSDEGCKILYELLELCEGSYIKNSDIKGVLMRAMLNCDAIFKSSDEGNILTYAMSHNIQDLIDLCVSYYNQVCDQSKHLQYQQELLGRFRDSIFFSHSTMARSYHDIIAPVKAELETFINDSLSLLPISLITNRRISELEYLIETAVQIYSDANEQDKNQHNSEKKDNKPGSRKIDDTPKCRNLAEALKQVIYNACELAAYSNVAIFINTAGKVGFFNHLDQLDIASLLQRAVQKEVNDHNRDIIQKIVNSVIKNYIVKSNTKEKTALCYLLEASDYQAVEMTVRAYKRYSKKLQYNSVELEHVNNFLIPMANEKLQFGNSPSKLVARLDVATGQIKMHFVPLKIQENVENKDSNLGELRHDLASEISFLDLFISFPHLFQKEAAAVVVEAKKENEPAVVETSAQASVNNQADGQVKTGEKGTWVEEVLSRSAHSAGSLSGTASSNSIRGGDSEQKGAAGGRRT